MGGRERSEDASPAQEAAHAKSSNINSIVVLIICDFNLFNGGLN